MTKSDFIEKLVGEGYDWKECSHLGEDGILVGSEKFDTVTHFTNQAIKDYNWTKLNNQVIQGKDIKHMSRVVGYYSLIHNWNKSKLGELADRRKGHYSYGEGKHETIGEEE